MGVEEYGLSEGLLDWFEGLLFRAVDAVLGGIWRRFLQYEGR